MSFSMFGGDSPPKGMELPPYKFMQRNLPVVIEQNVSYTRSDQQAGRAPKEEMKAENKIPNQPDRPHDNEESDEDAHFLRLAHDALVATSKESNLMVDPTIQDLLRRLQYALSPHGNPIKRLQSIRASASGQLMLHNFYNAFPNLSNDIFTGSQGSIESNFGGNFSGNYSNNYSNTYSSHSNNFSNNPSSDNPGWNFLLDKPSTSASPEPIESSLELLESRGRHDRKFPCTSCTMSFRRSLDLKRHEKQHLTIPANICPQCGKGFARKDALKRHLGTLTCKRNAEKKLYHKNLQYLKDQEWEE